MSLNRFFLVVSVSLMFHVKESPTLYTDSCITQSVDFTTCSDFYLLFQYSDIVSQQVVAEINSCLELTGSDVEIDAKT